MVSLSLLPASVDLIHVHLSQEVDEGTHLSVHNKWVWLKMGTPKSTILCYCPLVTKLSFYVNLWYFRVIVIIQFSVTSHWPSTHFAACSLSWTRPSDSSASLASPWQEPPGKLNWFKALALEVQHSTQQPPAWTPERDAVLFHCPEQQSEMMGNNDALKTSGQRKSIYDHLSITLKEFFALCSRLLIYLPRIRRNFKATPDRALYPEVKVDNRLAWRPPPKQELCSKT